MIGLQYPETVTLVRSKVSNDGYATEVIDTSQDVPAIFVQNTGYARGANRDDITSNSSVYLDPSNDFVMENFNRLESMYIIASFFGSSSSQSWYRIQRVNIGQDKLLGNEIDNIECFLEKSVEISHAS